MHLSALDLNLLVALEALLRLESVTEAAREVGLSQSAMSHALGRLRDQFGDELLIRSGRKMVPTARAEQLFEPLQEALASLKQAISDPTPFEPAQAEEEFWIATNDYALFTLLPPLIKRLQLKAPRIDLRVRELGRGPLAERLARGEIDLALTVGLPEHVPDTLYRRDLFQLELVSLVRRGNPFVEDELDLDIFCELPHILVSPLGDSQGAVDTKLAELGRSRRVAIVVPHFMVAPHLVAATDMILTTAKSVAESFAQFLPIRVVEPPLELVRGTISLVWHPRTHREASHKWLRKQIEKVAMNGGIGSR